MFNDPFRYSPHPLVAGAAEEIMHMLEGWSRMEPGCDEYEFERSLAEGKMLGVLVVQDKDGKTGHLAGFSGNVNGLSSFDGFVPPIFDLLAPDGHFKQKEAELIELNHLISSLESSDEISAQKALLAEMEADRDRELNEMRAEMALSKIRRDEIRSETHDSTDYEELIRQSQFQKAELRRKKLTWEERINASRTVISSHSERIAALKHDRASRSEELQKWIFNRYIVTNAKGTQASISEIFASQGLTPPGGTGECAAPKLLNHAFKNGLTPVAMGEFWYGRSPETAVRTHGHFYPSCTSKCGPLLGFMLDGLSLSRDTEEYGEIYKPEILYDDRYLTVVQKVSGIPSVPGLDGRISLQEVLSNLYGTEIHAVHRLDMDTSGVIIYAKDSQSATSLQRQFEERTVEKTYVARLSPQGNNRFVTPVTLNEGSSGTISLPLSPDYDERPRQRTDMSQGKPAVTSYKVTGINPDGTTDIVFRPQTGRTHQLRVHSAHILGLGRPIVGDLLYGGATASRLHLHALSISFIHPATGCTMTVTTENPFRK